MIGTLCNVAGIILGGFTGLVSGRNLTPDTQQRARLLFTALTVVTAAALVWRGLQGPFTMALKQLAIAGLSLSLGSLIGHLLGLQRQLNRLLRWTAGTPQAKSVDAASFATQAVVFTANPLGLIGAILEGATGMWLPLALKAGLDALASWGFAAAGSRNVMLSVLPMAALQGTLSLLAGAVATRFLNPAQLASLLMIGGLLVLVLAPVIYGFQKVPLANYLPALVLAPLFTRWWI